MTVPAQERDAATPSELLDVLGELTSERPGVPAGGGKDPGRATAAAEPGGVIRSLSAWLSAGREGDPGGVANRLIDLAKFSPSWEAQEAAAAADLVYRILETEQFHHLVEPLLERHAFRFRRPPLVDEVTRTFEAVSDSPLAGADVLACRHLMGSTVAELEAIRASIPGLRFVEVLGKPYSANRLAVLELRRRGFPVNSESCETPGIEDQPLGTYRARHRELARAAVRRYVDGRSGRSDRPLLVIDDGGALIDAVGQRVVSGDLRCPVVAVEQTRHGLYAIDRKFFGEPGSRGFAVVSVASSQAKIAHEVPLIAGSVVESTQRWLRTLDRSAIGGGLTSEAKIGVIGFGVVGAAVATRLDAGGATVAVYDRNRNKIGIAGHSASRLKMSWSVDNLLNDADVVVAASGGTAISGAAAGSLRHGTVLVSASSGDLEFGGLRDWKIETLPVLGAGAPLTPFDHGHGLLAAHSPDGRVVHVVNRGFPVNFDGGVDPIPPGQIQLTRALIVGAVLQAAGSTAGTGASLVGARGPFDVDESIDRFIAQRFASLSAPADEGPAPRLRDRVRAAIGRGTPARFRSAAARR